MGLIRKTLSVSTLGAVDFRSDKERTAAYTKGLRKEARKQTKILRRQQSEVVELRPVDPTFVPGQPEPYAPWMSGHASQADEQRKRRW